MVRFYENMIRKGGGTAESLRFAKQEMLKTKYGDPFFWLNFRDVRRIIVTVHR